MIVADWLHRQAAARPAHPALVAPDGTVVSYAELDARVEQLRCGLVAAGVRAGDRVAAGLENDRALVELIHAVPRAGAALVLIDARATDAEAAACASHVRPRLVVAAGPTEAAGRAAASASGAPLREPEALAALAPAGGALPPPGLDTEAPHTVVFTSGTSGRAKAVVLTAGNHLWSALGSAGVLGVARTDRWLACLPLHHVGGLAIVLRSAIYGTTLVLHRRFDAARVAAALTGDGVTLVSLVPTTLRRLLDAGGARPAALRAVLVGGAAAPPGLVAEACARGFPVAPTYGLTEAASQVATAAPDDPCVLAGAAGRPLPPTAVRVVDAEGRNLPAGEVGELHVCGPTVATGRLAADGALVPLSVDGWLATGDLARVDDAGAVTVLGRRDDLIVTGGENVAPDEVEAALAALPGVAEVAVVGLPDPEWGQVVAAWVVPAAGAAPSLEALRVGGRGVLAPHKLPRRLFVVAALPRTAAGKVRRAALREGAGR